MHDLLDFFPQNFHLKQEEVTAIPLLKDKIILELLITVLDYAILQSSGPS